ncbi:MAG: hypothetical protein P4M08_05275 [Oligoflexia bacterium]|nr:hypothetical protein [Oligoflexia bacterium]
MKTLNIWNFKLSKRSTWAIALFCVTALTTITVTSCNIFSYSKPSGDAQILSAARACFDDGDLNCAINYYKQLSSAEADTAISEEAFAALDQQGASMAIFMQFVGDIANGSGNNAVGQAMSNFAQRLGASPNPTAGESKRVAIWNAFNSFNQITNNTNLSQFVRFVGALSLVGEILSEAQGTGSQLLQSDLVQNAQSCLANGEGAGCATASACQGGTSLLSDAAISATTPIDCTGVSGSCTATAPKQAQPSGDTLNQALSSTVSALTNLGASGKFGSAVSTFTSIFQAAAPSSAQQVNQCFRYALISYGVGY